MTHWIHIRNADRILGPQDDVDTSGDIWIRDGDIAAIAPDDEIPQPAPDDDVHVLDATGCCVTPAFTDVHVHFRQPGQEAAETIATGCASAVAGGYATVFTMANTHPVCDRPSVVETVLAAAEEAALCEVVPVAALSRGLQGKALADLEGTAAAGARAFSDDGAWLADDDLAAQAFQWAARNDQVVMQHCEDLRITGDGVLHDCACVHDAGLPGISPDAEDRAVQRDIALAERFGTALHICHASTEGAVRAVRQAQERGLPVTAEVTPHHLVLVAEDAVRGGPDFKMKPPLRDRSDVDALIDALADGTLAAIATDHAPHTDDRKALGMLRAPYGAIGLETAFPAVFTHLVRTGRVPLERVVHALTAGPSRVARHEGARLLAGAPARLVLLDLETEHTVDRGALRSRSHNCPFDGMALRGWPVATVLGDRVFDRS